MFEQHPSRQLPPNNPPELEGIEERIALEMHAKICEIPSLHVLDYLNELVSRAIAAGTWQGWPSQRAKEKARERLDGPRVMENVPRESGLKVRGYLKNFPVYSAVKEEDFAQNYMTSLRMRYMPGRRELIPALERLGITIEACFRVKDCVKLRDQWIDIEDILLGVKADENLRNFLDNHLDAARNFSQR